MVEAVAASRKVVLREEGTQINIIMAGISSSNSPDKMVSTITRQLSARTSIWGAASMGKNAISRMGIKISEKVRLVLLVETT